MHRQHRQFERDAQRGDMSPLWIVLTLLPILGGAERFNCRGRILGAYYADAKSGCKAFHVCVNVAGGGIRDFRFYCPPGTLFHQEAQTCTDWGDDDPLACPADIYDGQFDLYKLGSGFDTRKVSHENRDDEAEFGLQRADTGDRRLSQNNGASNAISSDLRAAHSSDFFSGQRDRGRDDPLPPAPNAQLNTQPGLSPVSSSRQSFRRATTSRPKPTTTQYTTNNSPTQYPTSLPSKPNRYNQVPKRKLTRKRPIYTTTQSPVTFASNTFSPQVYSEQPQNYNRRIPSQKTQDFVSTVNVPPQYKDEYVEVSRVTPKPIRYFPNSPSSTPFTQPLGEPQPNKNSGLAEEYKYDTQSTSGIKAQNENRPFKVRNSFSVIPDVPNENDFLRSQSHNRERGTPTTTDFSTTTRGFLTSTPAYRNVNSISYEQEKNNYNQFPSSKQNYFYNPTSTPSTIATAYTTTTRYEPPQSLNTIAYNTNNAFNAQSSNFADSNEDDGQYRPPEGEDDGQYRPELYEKELLSGAHSLNIAASGNRLLEDQKVQSKNHFSRKPGAGTSAPRPFRPAPSVATSTQLSKNHEITYSTTLRSIPDNTQRTFDYYQTYTTTSRPFESKAPGLANNNAPSYDSTPARIASTSVPRTYDTQRNQNRETPQPANAPAPPQKPTPRPHHFAKPAHNKEDTSYDYAYYDSDSGFSEYDQIEEFGRTNTKG